MKASEQCGHPSFSHTSHNIGLVYGPSNSGPAKDGYFITSEEANAILVVCRNFKIHFNRKCCERSYENVRGLIKYLKLHN